MLVGVLSDSHDHMDRIREALDILAERSISTVIHCGDFVAPFALVPFVERAVRFYAVFGNNDGEIRGLQEKAAPIGGIQRGPYRFELNGKRFVINHLPWTDEQLAAEQGKTDFFLCGHTHIPEHRKVGDIIVINPGELCGWLKGRSTFGILDTSTGEWELIDLP